MNFQQARSSFWHRVRSGARPRIPDDTRFDGTDIIAERAQRRLAALLEQAGLDGSGLAERLEHDSYLVGYVSGVCAAAIRDAGLPGEVDTLGLATRVLGRLLGDEERDGPTARALLVSAHASLSYGDGRSDGYADWWG